MKWNFKWGKNNKQEMTPELTERGVNVYKHENHIKGAEHLGQKKCVVCGKWFTPTHPRQNTCSDECRKVRAKQQYDKWYKRASKGKSPITYKGKCVICGNKFETIYKHQVTCSDECRATYKQQKKNEWQKEHYHELYDRYKRKKQVTVEPVEQTNEGKETTMVQTREVETVTRPDGTTWTPPIKTCPTCGKQFICATNRQVFCSEECREKAYALKAAGIEIPKRTPKGYVSTAPKEPKACDICGKEFMPRTKKQRYCSKECGQEAMRLCTRKWHEQHEGRRKEYVARREAIKRGEIMADKYSETATVVRKLIETGVDDDVVAKYLQTVFGR